MPSAHVARTQPAMHASAGPVSRPPSSHCSPGSTRPFPQQAPHVPPQSIPCSSWLRIPSEHVARIHPAMHVTDKSSHSSPGSIRPLPQQEPHGPPQSTELSPWLWMPSMHDECMHPVMQESIVPVSWPASSHCSPGSIRPFPQQALHGPPQSTNVSPWLRMPSEHIGGHEDATQGPSQSTPCSPWF